MWCSVDYKRLLILQSALDKRVKDAEGDTEQLALIARTLVSIIDMKRILRMRPKPRDLDTTLAPAKHITLKPAALIEAPASTLANKLTPQAEPKPESKSGASSQ